MEIMVAAPWSLKRRAAAASDVGWFKLTGQKKEEVAEREVLMSCC